MGSISICRVCHIHMLLLLAVVLGCCTTAFAIETHSSTPTDTQLSEILHRKGVAPSSLVFIPNRGQLINTEGKLQRDIAYSAVYGGASLFFRGDGVSYVFTKRDHLAGAGIGSHDGSMDMLSSNRVDMTLLGANPGAQIIAEEQTAEYFNFYYGHCPDGFVDVPGFSRLVYQNIYNNIDLVFYSNSQGLKYDFIVRPGGDPRAINIAYRGAETPTLSGDGRLRITGALGIIEEEIPFCYQQSANQARIGIGSSFRLRGETISFDLDSYDTSSTLVIDPGILWATYLGGGADEGALAAGADALGNITVSGYTESVNFPVTVGAIQTTLASGTVDLFIAKMNSIGERLWTTYYGGNANDHSGTFRTGLAVTSTGSVVVTGHSSGGTFPITLTSYAGGLTDAFLLKISSSGQRLWSTFCGGIDADYGRDVAVDISGNIYMIGVTWSTRGTFSTSTLFQNNKSDLSDAFIAKYSSDGSPLTAAFYGGTGSDIGNAIALDPNNNIIIAGESSSSSLPLSVGSLQGNNAGGSDAFIAKISNSSLLQFQWSTFLGGSGRDVATGIATDFGGNIIATGFTASSNFPVSALALQSSIAGSNDAFIAKITAAGQQAQWATYYGGNGNDEARVVRVDAMENIIVAGETGSSNLPTSMPTYQESLAGTSDAFLLRLNSIGQQTLATYYGGSSIETANALTLSSGTMIVAGSTESTNLPISIGAMQKGNNGGHDAFIAKFGECNAAVDIIPNGSTTLCRGASITLDAGEGYSAYLWSNGATTRVVNVDAAGTYAVTVIGGGGCQATDSIKVVVNPFVQADRDLALCKGEIGAISAIASSSVGDLRYEWSPSTGLSCTNCPNPEVVIDATTTYTVTVTDGNGCRNSTTITVSINTAPLADAGQDMMACPGTMVPLFASGGTKYRWSPAEGLTCTECQGPLAVFPSDQASKTYYVVVTGQNGCTALDSVTLHAKSRPKAEAGRDTVVCAGTKLQLSGAGGGAYSWEPAADFDCPTCQNPSVTITGDREYMLTVLDASGCSSQDRVKIKVRPAQPLSSPSPKIDFGQLGECESNAIRSAVIHNTSSENITIDHVIFSNANIFSRVGRDGRPVPRGAFTVKAGASDTLYFLFVPQAAVSVAEHVTLQGTPCNTDYTFELLGRKTSIAVNTGNVSTMNFGSMLSCDAAERDTTITIHNTGSGTIAVRASIAEPFQILSDISLTKPAIIRPGEAYKIDLRFTAPTNGVFTEELVLPYEGGSCSGEMRIPVIATRTAPVARISTSEIAFPVLLGCESSSDTVITFENTGDVPLVIANANDNGIFQLGSGLPLALAPGQARSVPIRFRPSSAGVFNTTITFTGEPCGIVYSVDLVGIKQGVGFEVANTVNFPVMASCKGGVSDTVLTIANISGDDVEGKVKNVIVTGPFSTTLQPGDIIGSGSARDFGIHLAASGAGIYSGTVSLVLEPCDIVKTITLHAAIVETALAAENSLTDFGQVPLTGANRKNISFRNTGLVDIQVSSLAGVGNPFSVITTIPALPALLSPGEVLTVEIQYSGVDAGFHHSQVRAIVEEPCLLTATVEVTGETVSEKLPVIAATGINFGTVQLWTPVYKDLVVRNTGNAEATVDNVFIATGAAAFSVDVSGITLPHMLLPGDSITVPIKFAPRSVGGISGQVHVTSSVGVLSVELLGAGSDKPTGFAVVEIPRTISADVHARGVGIPVYLTNARDIEPKTNESITVEIRIRYNPSVFNYTGVTGGANWGSIIRENNRNILTVRREYAAAPQAGSLMFQLNGDILLGDEKATEITIENVQWGSTKLPILWEAKAGLLTVTGICEEGGDRLIEINGAFGITAISPNPSGGQVEITVAVVEYAETHLEIYNAFGKLAYEKVWTPLLNTETNSVASTHAFVIDKELPSGLYFVVLTSPARRATAKMIIEK